MCVRCVVCVCYVWPAVVTVVVAVNDCWVVGLVAVEVVVNGCGAVGWTMRATCRGTNNNAYIPCIR